MARQRSLLRETLIGLIGFTLFFLLLSKCCPHLAALPGLPQVYFLLLSLLMIKRHQLSATALSLRTSKWLQELGIGLAVYSGTLLILAVVSVIWHVSWDLHGYRLRYLTHPPALYTTLLLLLVAPLTEELFFRGVLWHGLQRRFSAAFCVVVTAILFALAHGHALLGPFLLGIASAAVLLWRRNLLPCIILHVGCNLNGVLLSAFAPQLFERFRLLFQ